MTAVSYWFIDAPRPNDSETTTSLDEPIDLFQLGNLEQALTFAQHVARNRGNSYCILSNSQLRLGWTSFFVASPAAPSVSTAPLIVRGIKHKSIFHDESPEHVRAVIDWPTQEEDKEGAKAFETPEHVIVAHLSFHQFKCIAGKAFHACSGLVDGFDSHFADLGVALRVLFGAAIIPLGIASCRRRGTPKRLVLAIGGSSGSGKGTLAIKLAHKLGVRHVLSTDTVRDFVRTKHPRSHPIWLSSYDNMPPEFSTDTQSTYEYQASLLLPALIHTLELSLEDTRCIIVEGVHLSVPTQLKLMAHNLEWCIVPVIVHIPSRDSHMVRFAGRSSTSEAFCLDPKYNKYISNFERIRQIQALNLAHYESLDNREEFLVVENNILDQAVEDVRRGLVQLLRLRYL